MESLLNRHLGKWSTTPGKFRRSIQALKHAGNVASWSNRKWSVIALSSFFVLALIGLRQILLTPGTIGHHWDWSLPSSTLFYNVMLTQSSQVWTSQFLGRSYGYGVSVLPMLTLLGSIGSAGVSGEVMSKALLLSVISTSGFSGYQLILEIIKVQRTEPLNSPSPTVIQAGSILGGSFYAFSPFLYNEMIGGALTQFVAYSIAPLAVLTYIRARANRGGKWRSALIAALVLSAVAMSLQYLVLVVIVMITISLPALRSGLNSMWKILLFWLPLNFYWLLPSFYSLQSIFAAATTQNSSDSILQNFQVHVPNLVQAFVGTGYWTDFFSGTIPAWFFPFWLIASLLVPSLALFFLLSKRTLLNVFPWVTVLIFSIVFETGSNSPLHGTIGWMVVNFPPMVLFKSPQHLIFPTILALSVVIGMFAIGLVKTLPTARKIGIFLALLVFVSVWVSPFFYGNLGGYVDVYRLPASYQKINDFIASDPETGFRVMYLPAAGSPHYLNNGFQSENQGGDPMLIYSPASVITSDLTPSQQAKDLASGVEALVTEQSPPINTSKILAFLNVKYVILRYDVVPNFGPLVGHWNSTLVGWNLQHLNGLRLMSSFPEAVIWKVELQRTPLIYAATNVIYDNPPIIGIRNWQVLSGEWTADQQFSLSGKSGILKTNSTYGDFDLSVGTQLTEDKDSFNNWVLWRGRDSNNYYFAGQTGIGYFTVGRLVNGQRTELFSRWMSYTRDSPVWVRVVARGQTFQVYSGDNVSWNSQFTFDDSSFRLGFVGLQLGGGGQYGHVIINDLNGTLLFRDTFDRSNLIELILSNRFTIGQTVIIPPPDTATVDAVSNATAQVTSGGSTSYVVSISPVGPFYLVYSESFDYGWTLESPGAIHILGNGYANAWKVDSTDDHRLSLVFQPERLFQFGVIVSVATIVASIILLTGAQYGLASFASSAKRCATRSRKRP